MKKIALRINKDTDIQIFLCSLLIIILIDVPLQERKVVADPTLWDELPRENLSHCITFLKRKKNPGTFGSWYQLVKT